MATRTGFPLVVILLLFPCAFNLFYIKKQYILNEYILLFINVYKSTNATTTDLAYKTTRLFITYCLASSSKRATTRHL